ncbi:MAG: hypothetical protein KDD83_08925, partial [Caldilineaceae bacterium]|nr:hypothetical protein [Caldilineaceae bacterium]
MATALLLPFLLQRPAMVAAQTSPLLGEAALTLPQSWTGPDSVTQAELADAMPPFALLDSQGEFSITRVEDAEGPRFRVLRAGDGQAAAEPGHLHFAWTVTGDELSAATGQVLNITFAARGYSPPAGVRFYIEEVTDAGANASSVEVNDVQWSEYALARSIALETTELRIGVDWRNAVGTDWVEFAPLTVNAVPAAEFDGALSPTETPRPPTPTPTATPVPEIIVVTSTPTAASVLAAATMAAQATADATSTGTPTPTPESMVTATFTPLPTDTPTPIVVTNTPTPENEATATVAALEAEARAFTTGTPTPYPAEALVLVATATHTPAPRGQPTRTPTPFFVLMEDIAPTNTPAPTPTFPAELVGKIVFKADFLGTDRRPDYMIMNPDGTELARLTGASWYDRAAERDHYSGDRRFYASVAKEQDGFRRIQLFYDFIEYATKNQLTFFGAGTAWDPAWSPVDEKVVFVSNESKNDEIWLVERDQWPA